MTEKLTIAKVRAARKMMEKFSIPLTHWITWQGCPFVWWVNDKTGECGLYGKGPGKQGETIVWHPKKP